MDEESFDGLSLEEGEHSPQEVQGSPEDCWSRSFL